MNILLVIRIFFFFYLLKVYCKELTNKKKNHTGKLSGPKIYASQSTSIQRTTTLRNFTLGFTLCYQVYINVPSYHKKVYNWIKIRSLTSSIFTFLTPVRYPRPSSHPNILPLLFFFMLFYTHMFTHTHKTRIFMWMRNILIFFLRLTVWPHLILCILSPSIFLQSLWFYFSLEVNSLLFYYCSRFLLSIDSFVDGL